MKNALKRKSCFFVRLVTKSSNICYKKVTVHAKNHRIIDDRIAKYESYIVFFSK